MLGFKVVEQIARSALDMLMSLPHTTCISLSCVFIQHRQPPLSLQKNSQTALVHLFVDIDIVPVRYRPNAASGGWSYGRDLCHCRRREKGIHLL